MNTDGMKFVKFHEYCDKCVHKAKKGDEEPCNECLTETVNLYSHKPLKWKEVNKKGN